LRKLDYFRMVDHRSAARRLGLEHWRFARHQELLAYLAHGQLQIEPGGLFHLQDEAR
jgi:hypothetical protein